MASLTIQADSASIRSPHRKEPVVLVGSALGIETTILDSLPAVEGSVDSNTLRIGTEEATVGFVKAVEGNVGKSFNLQTHVVTGKAALNYACEFAKQHRSYLALPRDRSLRDVPLVNLADETFLLARQVHTVREQIASMSGTERVERFLWAAPFANIGISRAIFHGFTKDLATDIAGTAGASDYRDRVVMSAIGKLENELSGTVPYPVSDSLVLLDDRASRKFNTLGDLSVDFARSGGFNTLAYVVAHADYHRYEANGELSRAPDGVPIIAPVFRYESVEVAQEAKRLKIKPPAEEFKELLYLPSSGHSLMCGFVQAVDDLKNIYNLLKIQIRQREKIEKITSELEKLGVRINDLARFSLLVDDKQCRDEAFGVKDMKELFSRLQLGGEPILEIKEHPEFDPDKIEVRRIPALWPGKQANNTFWNRLDGDAWAKFSLMQLSATIEYVRQIESVVRQPVPRGAFPFLELPYVSKLFASSCRYRPHWGAQKCLSELHEVLSREMGSGAARVWTTDALKAS